MNDWLHRRQEYLSEKLIPRRPTSGSPDLGRMYMETRDYDADLAEFNDRLATHLRECEKVLRHNAIARIHQTGKNKVAFTAHNPTDHPMQNVEIIVKLNVTGVSVMALDPGIKRWPDEPAWPSFLDERAWTRDLMNAGARLGATMPALGNQRVKMRRDGELIQIAYLIGDLRARGSQSTQPFTIVPVAEYELAQMGLNVSATAMDRSGIVDRQFVLPVDLEHGWPLSAIIHPTF
jgi:hypothetical protein